MAKNEDDLALLRSLRCKAGIVIALRARGRTLGALTLLMTEHSGRSYAASDPEFFEVFAGRVALALDNAGLFVELEFIKCRGLRELIIAVTEWRSNGWRIEIDPPMTEPVRRTVELAGVRCHLWRDGG